jgi:DNA polymerase-3 subunit epsilon
LAVTLAPQHSFDDLGAPLRDVTFCVLDIETTGGSALDDSITEIGAIRYRGGFPAGEFQSLVNPRTDIPPFITVLTGITRLMVAQAPSIEEVMPSFLEFLGGAVIVGHNVGFDIGFLSAAAERLGYGSITNQFADTGTMARRLCRSEVRNLKLQTLAAYFRSPVRPTHRALDDARATAHVFWCLLERAGTIGVTHLDDLIALRRAKGDPHYGKMKLTESLPRRPGVYLFKDRTGAVTYVGKAKNLRNRVRSYFYGDNRRTIHAMLRELDSIEHVVCASELEAEVTELRLIHEHIPRHNRRSKPPKTTHWIKLTREDFPRLALARTRPREGEWALGPFRSRKAAELVLAAVWDAIPIRRCRPRRRKTGPETECAFAQIGAGLCPCGGDVDPEEYAEVIALLQRGVDQEPDVLLNPLAAKMASHARALRYEEAGWLRDRHHALARAIERKRVWETMASAGVMRIEGADGSGALIQCGRLITAWSDDGQAPLIAGIEDEWEPGPFPPSIGAAEEARILWRWATTAGARILDASRPPFSPRFAVRRLTHLAEVAGSGDS